MCASLGEIPEEKSTDEVALAVIMASACLYPPYLNNYTEHDSDFDRELLLQRAAVLVVLLLDGLKK